VKRDKKGKREGSGLSGFSDFIIQIFFAALREMVL
jgi:hypothetical protein